MKLFLIFVMVSCALGFSFWLGYQQGVHDTMDDFAMGALQVYIEEKQKEEEEKSDVQRED